MRRRTLLSSALAAMSLVACRRLGLDRLAVASEAASVAPAGDDPAPGGCPLVPGGRADWAGHFESGVYRCAVCGQELFASAQKYNPGAPWPSFWAPLQGAVVPVHDREQGRISESAVQCSRCGSPLGDVYRDGPPPTGLRYCIVSAALVFEPAP